MSIITLNTRSIPDSAITTAKINADAITSAKIADDAVVTAAIADDAVVAASLADNAVSLATSTVTGTLPTANGGTGATSFTAGKVLQVVQGKFDTHVSSNAADWVATGLEAAITPSATSSKVFISITCGAIGGSKTTAFRIWKDSSHLNASSGITGGNRENVAFRTLIDNDTNHASCGGYNYLDSPSTTSATTYKLYWKSQNSSTSSFNYALGNDDVSHSYGSLTTATITLMEIAG